MLESFINSSIKSGSGVKLNQKLRNENDTFLVEMKIIGFDDEKCPFVEYTKVQYKRELSEEEFDKFEVGDVLPFPWTEPARYLIK